MSQSQSEPSDRDEHPRRERRAPVGLSGFVVGDNDICAPAPPSSQRPKPKPFDRSAHASDKEYDPALPSPRGARTTAEAAEIQAMMEDELGPQANSAPSSSFALRKSILTLKGKNPFKPTKSSSTTASTSTPSLAQSLARKNAPKPPTLQRKSSVSSLKTFALSSNPRITDTFKPRPSAASTSSAMGPPVTSHSSSSMESALQAVPSSSHTSDDDGMDLRPGNCQTNPIQLFDHAAADSDSQASNGGHKRKDHTPEAALKAATAVWAKAHKDVQDRAEAQAEGREWKPAPGKIASTVYLGFDAPFIGTKHGQTCILFPCKCCIPPQNIHRPLSESSTSNLLAHSRQMKNKEDKQLSIMEMLSKKAGSKSSTGLAVLPPSTTRQMMVAWVSESGRPIAIVEDCGFLAFLSEEQRDFMPSRWTVSRDITRVFNGMKEHLKMELAAVHGCFHLATDVWTSANGYSFLELIVCYQIEGQAIRRLLEMVPFLTTHDSEHLANATFEVLEKYGITGRLWNIVSDNASENTKMMKLLAAKDGLPRFTANRDGKILCRVRCTAHVLNLISKAVLSAFTGPRKKKKKQAANEDKDGDAEEVEKDDEEGQEIDEDDCCDDMDDDDDQDDADDDEAVDGAAFRAVEDEDDFEISTLLHPNDTFVAEDEEDLENILKDGSPTLSIRQTLELQMRNKEIGTALRKIAWLAQQLRYSPVKRRMFRDECQRLLCKGPYTIVRDVATRWNSTLDMIESALRLWKGVVAFTERDDTPVPKIKRIKRSDEDDLRKLCDFLKPIADATLKFSHKDVPTIGEVIGLFEDLDRFFIQVKNKEGEEPVWTQAAARAHSVNAKYYGLTEQADVYTLAMLLHPNYRATFMDVLKWPDDWKKQAEKLLRDVYAAYYQISPEAEQADGSQTANFDKLDPTTQALMRMAKAKQDCASHDVIAEWVRGSHSIIF
ncbi:hypothetical protein A4X06_0g4949 [Tilletia controversa]|uniref:AC transposase n=1 Tax=Tilletia controversa TaxID=13291 RepID=A0A8X7MSE4_9BASI|nr:hypothetical protein A4X06_0g4949 [Tilletia controversa]